MEDRFRFRAWHKKKHIMLMDVQNMYDHLGNWYNSKGEPADSYEFSVSSFGCFFEPHYDTGELESVVMQCTGLKDKNGKLIYEGDIIKDDIYQEYDVEYQQLWVIEWAWMYPGPGFRAGSEAFENFGQMTIVGNIYENPELLNEIKSK